MFKAQYFLLKISNKFRIFTVTNLHHLFIRKKYLTFPISDRNKFDDKKVTDYRNIDTILPMFFEHVHYLNTVICLTLKDFENF